MRRLRLRLVVLQALLAVTAALWVFHANVAPARADHSDGNMPGEVNYWLVDEGELRVCDNSSLITTSQFNNGLAYWNDGLGWTMLVNSCTNFGVELIDVPNGACGCRENGNPVGACAEFPDVDSPQVLELRVAPYLPNESSASDNVFFPFVIAHELGHNLGFNHVFNPPNCTHSIMQAPRCDPGFPTSLRQVDKDNYHYGYHADAVASFAGTSGGQGPHAVRFTWDGSDIHNEREYLINWRNNCTGQWQVLATAGTNPCFWGDGN